MPAAQSLQAIKKGMVNNMEKVKKALTSNRMVTFVWVLGIIGVWEIGATVIAQSKRTPEKCASSSLPNPGFCNKHQVNQ